MWPLLAIMVALVNAATSRSDNLNFKNIQNALPANLNNLNSLNLNNMLRTRPDSTDRMERYESSAAAAADSPIPDDLSRINSKLQNAEEYLPLKKLLLVDDIQGEDYQIPDGSDERISIIEDEEGTDLGQLSALLTRLLQEPGGWDAPLVLVEEPITPWDGSSLENSQDSESDILPTPWKRSRYYRRYPWKRQNSRSRYDYDASRYLCTPTREDVFQLLVALHDARQGNKSRTVNFCNRRRPAGSVFTNIRFLGRRK